MFFCEFCTPAFLCELAEKLLEMSAKIEKQVVVNFLGKMLGMKFSKLGSIDMVFILVRVIRCSLPSWKQPNKFFTFRIFYLLL